MQVLSNLPLNEVFDKISNLEYMIAMRFHANVVAIKSNVKTLAISEFEEEFNGLMVEGLKG